MQLTLSVILNSSIIAILSVAIMIFNRSFNTPITFTDMFFNGLKAIIPFVVFIAIIGYTKGKLLFIHITDNTQLYSASCLCGLAGSYLYKKLEEQNKINKLNPFLIIFELLIRKFVSDEDMKQRLLKKIIDYEEILAEDESTNQKPPSSGYFYPYP